MIPCSYRLRGKLDGQQSTVNHLPVVPAQAGTSLGLRKRVEQVFIPCVYIMASRPKGAIYTGVTSNLPQRVWQHKGDYAEGHTSTYQIHGLVWYEVHDNMESAITREKRIKKWRRPWKIRLIEEANPTWKDLYEEICS